VTLDQLIARFPHVSRSVLALNASDCPRGLAPSPVVERDPSDGTLAASKVKTADTGRFLVRVTSYRRRLLDEDNLSEKYFCDCCRYAGLIPDDAPDKTKIEVTQERVKTKAEERTVVEIIEP
jgi:hypothetical protein